MEIATKAAFKIHFIGATANNKLKVVMVGITTIINANVLVIAPKPTAVPPRHPTMVKMTQIAPKRLNSVAESKVSNLDG